MSKPVDCFFIGHNEMDFVQYKKNIYSMGVHSGAYRDFDLSFFTYNQKAYNAKDIFNLFYCSDRYTKPSIKPFYIGETFMAAIAYLVTFLSRRGLSCDYVNAFQEQKAELAEKLAQENILTIAIITTMYVSAFPILEIMEFIRKHNQRARIIVGGPFISTQVRALEPPALDELFQLVGADFYVNSSQGEDTLVKLIKALKNDLPLDQVNNIYYRPGNRGSYIPTPLSKENNKISANYVNWDLFSNCGLQYVNLRTAISCPFSCAFCGFPQHAGKFQWAEVETIEKELNLLHKQKSVKAVTFIDDTLNVPVKRFKEILRLMIRNKYEFKWNSHFRCQFADRETIELMKESGCEGVFLGIESGSEPILKNMNKAAKVDDYRRGISLLKEYDIMTYASFIIGFPGETDEAIAETIAFIRDSEFDFYRAQAWYCDPITPIWKQRQTYGLNGNSFEWAHATMDSRKASDLVDHIFLSINTSTWVPQYYFDYDAIYHLLHRGLSLDQLKRFLADFNRGVEEKIRNPLQKEVSFETIKQLKDSFIQSNCCDAPAYPGEKKINKTGADFDF